MRHKCIFAIAIDLNFADRKALSTLHNTGFGNQIRWSGPTQKIDI
jgi:hypothetical protein